MKQLRIWIFKMNKSFFAGLFLLTVCGCSATSRVPAPLEDDNAAVADKQNSITELDCINQKSCSLSEEYVNALGQHCRALFTQEGELVKFCKPSEKTAYWEKIRVL